jgi:hypothetical protein
VRRLGGRGLSVAACAAAVSLALAASAAEPAAREQAEVEWAPAKGDVAAYGVFVSRDGGPFRSEQYTREPRARIAGRPGETLRVRVRAYGLARGRSVASAPSEVSEPIRFAAAPRASAAAPAAVGAAPPPAAFAPPAGTAEAPRLRVEARGDFDADGRLDWLATLGSWRHPVVLFAKGGALEQTACLDSLAGIRRALVADFDGDGRDELALDDGAALSLLRIERGGATTLLRREALPPGARLVAADLDGDRAASLVVYEPATGRLTERLRGPPTHDFGVVQPLHALHAGDFDADGRDDLLLQPRPGHEAELWLMRPGGRFDVAALRLRRSVSVEAVRDVDGDGRLDLVGAEAGRGELHAFLLDGARVIGERALAR